jgi:hypothetical protein
MRIRGKNKRAITKWGQVVTILSNRPKRRVCVVQLDVDGRTGVIESKHLFPYPR